MWHAWRMIHVECWSKVRMKSNLLPAWATGAPWAWNACDPKFLPTLGTHLQTSLTQFNAWSVGDALLTFVCQNFWGHRHSCRHVGTVSKNLFLLTDTWSHCQHFICSCHKTSQWQWLCSLILPHHCRAQSSAQVVCRWQTPMWHRRQGSTRYTSRLPSTSNFYPFSFLMLMNGIAASIKCFGDAHSCTHLSSSIFSCDHSSYIYSLSILRWRLMQLIILAISHIGNKNTKWVDSCFL